MRFKQFLMEQAKAKADDKEKKIVFKETDGFSAFPENTMAALEKQVSVLAKDLEVDWKSAAEVVDAAFEELDVPKPQSFLKHRWAQYVELLSHAVKQLHKARGLKSGWTQSI